MLDPEAVMVGCTVLGTLASSALIARDLLKMPDAVALLLGGVAITAFSAAIYVTIDMHGAWQA